MASTADETTLSNPFHLAHAISNIRTLIPVTLDIKTPNYQKWSHFFTVTVGRFSLTPLLLGLERPSNISNDDWTRGDFLLQSWIYSTITDDLSSMILSKTASAHDLWQALASLFTDNKEYRAIHLQEQFKSLKKSSLSIHEYCKLIKTTADSLADVGHEISDKQLVLQTLHGLPKNYSTIVNLISFQTPLPTFLQVRSLLQMEEVRIGIPDPSPQPTALYTNHHPPPQHPYPSGRGNGNYRGRGRGGGRGRGRNNRSSHPMQHYGFQQYSQPTWRYPTPPLNPIPSPNPPHPQVGVSSTIPPWQPSPQQAYHVLPPSPSFPVGSPSPQHSLPPPWSSPSAPSPWAPVFLAQPNAAATPSDFSHQFDSLTLRPPTDSTWYMDTGASSHMASDPGILSSLFNSRSNSLNYVIVGNGSTLPITSSGHTMLPNTPYHLSNTLIAPNLVKNLISVL